MACANCAGPPASKPTGCEVRSRIASSPPGRMWSRKAISLHIVPLGRKSPASCPSSSATRSQYFMLVVMVFFTTAGLWLLSASNA